MPTVLATAVLLLLVSPAAASIQYDITDLGIGSVSLNFGPHYSMNDQGQVVGAVFPGSGKHYAAALIDPTGSGIDITYLAGDFSLAFSINDNGEIVGQAKNPSGYFTAVLFDPTGGGANIDLGTLGEHSSEVLSINNNGQIVGDYRSLTKNWDIHAALFDYTGAGNNIDLGTLGGNNSFATSINNLGDIVGVAEREPDPHEIIDDYRATLFDLTGAGNNIELTKNDEASRAYCINDHRQIVGLAYCISEDVSHATLFDYTGNGNNVDLGTLSGGGSSVAYSINNNGQIVGESKFEYGTYHATLFDITGGGNNLDLNNLIDPTLGWNLRKAECINDNGWIVGSGYNPEGHYHVYLLTPIPEPETVFLFGFGGLALLRKRKSKLLTDEQTE